MNLDQLRSNASFWPYSVSSSALFCIKPFPKHSKKASVSLRFSFMKVEAQSKGKPNYKENFWVSCFSDGLHSLFLFLSSSDLSVNERNQWMNQKGVFSQVLLFHCSLSFFILFMDGFLVLKFRDKWLWTLNDCLWCFHIYFVEKAGENLEETFCCYFFLGVGRKAFKKKKKKLLWEDIFTFKFLQT